MRLLKPVVIALVLMGATLTPTHAQETAVMGSDTTTACCWNSGHSAASQYGYTPENFRNDILVRFKGGIEAAQVYIYPFDDIYLVEFEAYPQTNCENVLDTTYPLSIINLATGEPFEFSYEAVQVNEGHIDGIGITIEPLMGLCWARITLVG